MRKRLLAIIATAAMVVTMIPSMVFANEVTTVNSYDDILNALQNNKTNIVLGSDIDMSSGTWTKLGGPGGQGITIENVTFDGNNHVITVKDAHVNNGDSNGKVLFAPVGGCTFKNIKFNLPETDAHAVFSSTGDNAFINIAIIGNGDCNGIQVNDGTTTVEKCTFKNTWAGVYTEYVGEKTIIKDSTFDNCAATIIQGNDSIFSGNTLINGKLNVVGSTEVTENTFKVTEGANFEDNGRVKFYNENSVKAFSGNTLEKDIYLASNVAIDTELIEELGNNIYANPEKALDKLDLSDEDIEKIIKASEKYAEEQNTPTAPAKPTTPADKPEKSPNTGDNSMAPFAVAGMALAAMAAVVATRRRTN